jgi:hypothetical protein
MGVAAVGVGDPQLELARAHQALLQEPPVLLQLRAGPRARRAPDDLAAVGAEERAAVIARREGEPLDVLAVLVHAVQLEVAVPHRGEDDGAVLRADRRLGVIAGGVGEALHAGAVDPGLEDVVRVVERPHVALAAVRLGRAGGAAQLRRGPQHLLVAGEEVGAGGGALAVRHRNGRGLRGEGVDPVDDVAGVAQRSRLVDELGAVKGPVSLGVLSAEGDPPDVLEARLVRAAPDAVGERQRRATRWSESLGGRAGGERGSREERDGQGRAAPSVRVHGSSGARTIADPARGRRGPGPRDEPAAETSRAIERASAPTPAPMPPGDRRSRGAFALDDRGARVGVCAVIPHRLRARRGLAAPGERADPRHSHSATSHRPARNPNIHTCCVPGRTVRRREAGPCPPREGRRWVSVSAESAHTLTPTYTVLHCRSFGGVDVPRQS